MNFITIFPDTIHKPTQCDNKETIFCSMLQRMLKFVSAKTVLYVKDFMTVLQNYPCCGNRWQATTMIMVHKRCTEYNIIRY